MFNPTSITFIGYLIVMVAVGLFAWRYTKNFNDYILGGRRLGSIVTGLSVGASDMSGWLLMGLPGAVFLSGICESWIAIGLAIGTYLNWKIVASPLRVYTEVAHNALTLPDYFTHRFEDKSKLLRIISAFVILLFFAIYSASGMVASARLFEMVFDLPYSTALILGTIATLAYVFLGGFLAVSWTDTIQASMMCLALIITPLAVMWDLGGWTATINQVSQVNANHLNMLQGQTFIGVVSLLAWGLGYFGQPHILVRFMAAKDAKVMPQACRISMIWLIFCLGGAVATGFFGAAYFAAHTDVAAPVVANHERVFMVLSTTLFSPWIGGILLSAILAAVMSRLDAFYLFDFENAGTAEWMVQWDGRMQTLMEREDTEGFSKMLLCGEEDYGSRENNLDYYTEQRRREKVRLAMLRLLCDEGLGDGLRKKLEGYLKAHTKGCASEESWQVVLAEGETRPEYVRLFLELGCVTRENIEAMIRQMREDQPQLRASFLRYRQEKLGQGNREAVKNEKNNK